MTLFNSYNCGVLGYHTETIARTGLVALGFTNAPASIAPSGAKKPVVGTNPWSLAVPDGKGGAAFVIDQSASVVAKSEVMKKARAKEAIPLGWALDPQGQPTTDAEVALKGTMAPSGGYKGVGAAILVEVMAACLTGATPGIEASTFGTNAGGPPKTGQCFIAINPAATSGGAFAARIATVISALTAEDGARLPGARKAAVRAASKHQGVTVDRGLYDTAVALAGAKP
jgi:(2R)-3-sulfolactate dehydrogenase (NADP+)